MSIVVLMTLADDSFTVRFESFEAFYAYLDSEFVHSRINMEFIAQIIKIEEIV